MPRIPDMTNLPLPVTGADRLPFDRGDASVDDLNAYLRVVNALSLITYPERPDAAGTFFSTQGAGDPLSVWFAPTINTVAGFGPTIQYTGGAAIFTRGVFPAGPDRVYEVEAEVEQVSVGSGETPAVRLAMRSLKSDYTDTDGTPDAVSTITAALTAGQIVVVRYRFGYAAPAGGAAWADPSTAIFLRARVNLNIKTDGSGNWPNSIARIRRFKVTDVTDLVATEVRLTTAETDVDTLEAGGETMTTAAIVAGVVTLDLSGNKRNFKTTVNANITSILITNIPAGPKEFSWSWSLFGDGTARTISGYPAAVRHNGGSAPTYNSTNGKKTRLTMTSDDGGTSIHNYKAGET